MMSELNSRATTPSVDTNMMSELNSRAQQKEVEAIEALNACLTLATIQNINRCIPSIRDALVLSLIHIRAHETVLDLLCRLQLE